MSTYLTNEMATYIPINHLLKTIQNPHTHVLIGVYNLELTMISWFENGF